MIEETEEEEFVAIESGIYDSAEREELIDSDEISAEEEAFMHGYEDSDQ